MGAIGENPRWAEAVPDPATYRAPPGRTRSEVVAEQNAAAGGRHKRGVTVPGGFATASVELKFLNGRRIYAYLRYHHDGRTRNVYLGEAPGGSREERLRAGWRLARHRGLTS